MTQKSKISAKIESLYNTMQSAYDTRSAANAQQSAFFAKEKKLFNVHAVAALHDAQVDVSALAQLIANADKSNANAFLAKYACEKVRKIALALAQNSLMQCDDYTQSILLNSRALESLNAKSALVCLSRNVEFSELDTQQSVKRYKHCEATTASTQRSSTREALRVLNIASVTKAKRDDAIAFSDSEIAKRVQALCDAALAQ